MNNSKDKNTNGFKIVATLLTVAYNIAFYFT